MTKKEILKEIIRDFHKGELPETFLSLNSFLERFLKYGKGCAGGDVLPWK